MSAHVKAIDLVVIDLVSRLRSTTETSSDQFGLCGVVCFLAREFEIGEGGEVEEPVGSCSIGFQGWTLSGSRQE
ncbi:hypothetical protein KC19_9G099200 [Ceratodon purpureus]|uniref:Uncharacterized protein n=1 Tax=Ceratodon purpureus TaxID=3225 RepID=A0A8T0GU36_CERPU|nr:hypothetical protein KC19_9G099200 [Ceratodon purpureus]